MKTVLVLAVAITSMAAFAQQPKMTFEQQKEGASKFLTERMVELQKNIACVNTSKVQADLDACRAKMQKQREDADKKRAEALERIKASK
jgi:hypothetical protein